MFTLTGPRGTVDVDAPIRDGARQADDSTYPWRFRARYSALMGVGALVLAVWITALAATLPTHHTADGWSVTWVGFDCAELVAFVVTAWSAWRGRQLTMPASLVAATLLLCDAWFDVALSWHTTEQASSIAAAAFVEVPLAALLWRSSYVVARLTVHSVHSRLGEPTPTYRVRDIQLFSLDMQAHEAADPHAS